MSRSSLCETVSQAQVLATAGKGLVNQKSQGSPSILAALSNFGLCFTVLLSLTITLFTSSVSAAYRPVLPIDNNCTISILNRTVTPDPAGLFQLENVPSFMGKIRARATCVRAGVSNR